MARPKAFDRDTALQGAIGLFREKGYAGASTDDLLASMGIGRQSMYDTFGDKRGLFLAALERHNADSIAQFIDDMDAATAASGMPLGGLEAALKAFARRAGEGRNGCMGVSSVFEFGRADAQVVALLESSSHTQLSTLERQLDNAKTAGELSSGFNVEAGAIFVATSLAGLRVAARGGVAMDALEQIVAFTMLALRAQTA
jgi:AcrR family transcriptional regulator